MKSTSNHIGHALFRAIFFATQVAAFALAAMI
jgi:hypothetical protein